MKFKRYKENYFVFIYEVSIFPFYLLSELLHFKFCNFIGLKNLSLRHISYWQNRKLRIVANLQLNRKISKFIFNKVKSKRFRQKMLIQYFKEMYNLHCYIKQLAQKNLKKQSNSRLWQYLKGFSQKFQKMYLWGWMPNGLEGHEGRFSQFVQSQLKGKLKRINKIKFLNEYFSILVTSTKEIPREQQEKDLLKIIIKISKNNNLKKIFLNRSASNITKVLKERYYSLNQEILYHQKKYAWLLFKYEGPVWDKLYLISLIKDYLKDKISPVDKLERIKESKSDIKRLQRKYLTELKIDKSDKLYQDLLFSQDLMYAKEHQKDYLFQVYYYLDFLVREAASRLQLSPTQFRHFLVPEMKQALVFNKYDVNTLNDRIENSILIYGKNKITRMATGKEAEMIAKIMFPPLPKLKTFKGDCAASGKVKGRVKIIQETTDISKMKKGDIFVTTRSNPNLLPAMRQAAAIIADIGGITSHAAIIARELKIPAVVGVKFASMVLKDGNLVEVDANNGVVKKIK